MSSGFIVFKMGGTAAEMNNVTRDRVKAVRLYNELVSILEQDGRLGIVF